MSPSSPTGGSEPRRWIMPALLVGMLVLSVPGAIGAGDSAAGSTAGRAAAPQAHPATSHPGVHPVGPAPAVGVTGTFYSNSSVVAGAPTANVTCSTFGECYNQAQEPNVLTLNASRVAVSYSLLSQDIGTCLSGEPNATGNTSIRVAYSISNDGGVTFGAPNYFPVTCPYIQQLEPSFAVSSNGDVYGTYVEANVSGATVLGTFGVPALGYVTRTSDALVFVDSSNHATSFSSPVVIANAGLSSIARPALAAFGQSIYIAYENLSNGSGPLPGTNPATSPISVQFVYSTNGGSTWNGPVTLPGLGATQFNTSLSPSIAVSPTGVVAVAYGTNRHCLAYCALAVYDEYGDDIVVSTSATNGSTWSGPHVVARDTGNGEATNYNGNYNPFGSSELFESAPLTAIAYNPTLTSWDVAWVGAVNLTMDYYYDQWQSTQGFAATSSNGGLTWTNGTVGHGLPNNQNTYAVGYFNPGVAVSPTGTEFLSLTWYNSSNGGCGAAPADYFSNGYTQFITTSSDGVHFGSLVSSTVAEATGGYSQYFGFRSSVAFNTTGAPLVGYALPAGYSFSPSFTYLGQLDLAMPYSGPTVTVNGIVGSLALGAKWSFSIDGNEFQSGVRSINVTNVPALTASVVIEGNASVVPDGFWAVRVSTQSGPESTILTANTVYWFNDTQLYGVNLHVEPLNIQYFYFQVYNYSASPYLSCFFYWESGPTYFYSGGNSFPWYFPVGTHLDLGTNCYYPAGQCYYSYIGIYYWNGTGSGSYTGPGTTGTIVVNGPINETAWAQAGSTFNITVQAPGLPSNASYRFAWDGVSHLSASNAPVHLSGVTMGPHWVTGATATTPQAGWEYFGQPTVGNPVAVPEVPIVNLSFAHVDLGAAAGTVAFHAIGLVSGTVWHVSFNGTELSSSTAWINFTARPGEYPVHGYPVVAADGSAGYAPSGFGPLLNVTPSGVYPVTFNSAYAVTIEASAGGHVTPAPSTSWLLPGTKLSYNATPNPGFTFLGWSGAGSGSVNGTSTFANFTVGGPIQEAANFAPLPGNRFNVTFTQTAIPAGTWWTVYVGGTGYSSDTGSLTVHGLNACTQTHYSLAVPFSYSNGSGFVRYAPTGVPATVCGGTVVPLSFETQNHVSLEATAGGSAQATTPAGTFTGSFWVGSTDSATFLATPSDPSFTFLGWNGSGSGSFNGTLNPHTVLVGGPVSELAVFAPTPPKTTPKDSVTFVPNIAFAAGTLWSVWFGGSTYASTGATLTIAGLAPGAYSLVVETAVAPDGLTQYQPFGQPSHVTVSANLPPVNLTYRTSYWLSVSGLGGGTVGPRSGWVTSGATVELTASPGPNQVFKSWSGTGTGAYSGTASTQNITVGSPVTEVASFVVPAPSSTTVTSIWNSGTLWAELAIAGLVVGLIAGVVAMRLRQGPPPSPPADTPSSGASSGGSPDSGEIYLEGGR